MSSCRSRHVVTTVLFAVTTEDSLVYMVLFVSFSLKMTEDLMVEISGGKSLGITVRLPRN